MDRKQTIQNLNTALQMEITATHQYQLHAQVLDDWGLPGLADMMRQEQAEEIGHSDRFLDRILFFGGEPEIAFEKAPVRATSLREMFAADLKDEENAIRFYTQAAKEADAEGDIGSRMLFEQIVLDEEGHKAWLETQLALLERLGEGVYAARFLGAEAGDV